jgi:transcriptional regulator with XRE-family HTH domain
MGVSVMTSVTEFTKDELRRLRYRLGWSQAEMARNLKVELASLSGFESGAAAIPATLKSSLIRISQQADSNADSCQRRAIAEVLMDERGLSQIHNFDCDPDAIPPKGRA